MTTHSLCRGSGVQRRLRHGTLQPELMLYCPPLTRRSTSVIDPVLYITVMLTSEMLCNFPGDDAEPPPGQRRLMRVPSRGSSLPQAPPPKQPVGRRATDQATGSNGCAASAARTPHRRSTEQVTSPPTDAKTMQEMRRVAAV